MHKNFIVALPVLLIGLAAIAGAPHTLKVQEVKARPRLAPAKKLEMKKFVPLKTAPVKKASKLLLWSPKSIEKLSVTQEAWNSFFAFWRFDPSYWDHMRNIALKTALTLDGPLGPFGPLGIGFTPTGKFLTPAWLMDQPYYKSMWRLADQNPYVKGIIDQTGPLSKYGPLGPFGPLNVPEVTFKDLLIGVGGPFGPTGFLSPVSGAIGAIEAAHLTELPTGVYVNGKQRRVKRISVPWPDGTRSFDIQESHTPESYRALMKKNQLDDSFVITGKMKGRMPESFEVQATKDGVLMVEAIGDGTQNPGLSIYRGASLVGTRKSPDLVNVMVLASPVGTKFRINVLAPAGSGENTSFRLLVHRFPIEYLPIRMPDGTLLDINKYRDNPSVLP